MNLGLPRSGLLRPPNGKPRSRPRRSSSNFPALRIGLMDKSKDFYTRFPTNSHAAEARKQEFDMTGVA
jgi:hypothetical protein